MLPAACSYSPHWNRLPHGLSPKGLTGRAGKGERGHHAGYHSPQAAQSQAQREPEEKGKSNYTLPNSACNLQRSDNTGVISHALGGLCLRAVLQSPAFPGCR